MATLNHSFATRTFTLTALGKAAAQANGCIGRNGQATALGLTAYALALASNGTNAATGAAIVKVMQAHPAFASVRATYNATMATKWCQCTVLGLCRNGLAK